MLIIYNNPTTGYDLSPYANLPLITYVLLSFSIFGGMLVILFNSSKDNNLSLFGFIILLIAFFIIIGLPVIKNFFINGSGDVLTHLGYQQDLLISNQFSNDDFYPILHIFISSLSTLSGLNFILIYKVLAIFISILFFVFMYLFNSAIFKEKQNVIIASSLAIIPIFTNFYTQLTPYGFSLMLVPLIMYLYFNRNKYNYVILLLILLLLVPFSHPLVTITLLVYFLIIEIVNAYFKGEKFKISFNPFLILLITFFLWFSSSYIFSRNVKKLISWTQGELYAPADQISDTFVKLNFTLFDKIILFLKMYGSEIFLLSLAFLASLIILKKIKTNKNFSNKKVLIILICLIVNVGLAVLFLFTGDPEFQAIRSFSFIFMLSVPLAGYALYELMEFAKKYFKKKIFLINICIALLITSASIVGFLAMYPSPYILQPSSEVSKANFEGLEWFFENKDLSIKNIRLESAANFRFANAIYGKENVEKNRKDILRYGGWSTVPDHLGYANYTYLGQNLTQIKYFPISTANKVSYTKLWYQVNRYNNSDFDRLNNDITGDKFYSNGDLDVWIIFPY